MVERPYVPDRGDIVWLTFTPQAGHEQAGHRPALVLSPRDYNDKTSLALFCPITSKATSTVTGVVLSDQIKSLDWRARCARFACNGSPQVVSEVLEQLAVLLEP